MKRALLVSTVARQFYLFEKANIEVLEELGYEIHCAADMNDRDKRLSEIRHQMHHVAFSRSPISLKNISAAVRLAQLIRTIRPELIHCHSPVGGVVGRLIASMLGVQKIIYTAHGFHFFKGSTILSWTLFYPLERALARLCHYLITINEEDYRLAQSFGGPEVIKLPGIGIDTRSNREESPRALFIAEQNLPSNACIVLMIAEMIPRKNHKVALQAFARVRDEQLHLVLCGNGALQQDLQRLAQNLGVAERVHFLGYRDDVNRILAASDLFLLTSLQEGLPVATLEAMNHGLPVICSDVRGNRDLIHKGRGGYLCAPSDVEAFAERIDQLKSDPLLRQKLGYYNKERIKQFDSEVVKSTMRTVYQHSI
jgi:glycosyltransferase involved in cell wall biosynthesis